MSLIQATLPGHTLRHYLIIVQNDGGTILGLNKMKTPLNFAKNKNKDLHRTDFALAHQCGSNIKSPDRIPD